MTALLTGCGPQLTEVGFRQRMDRLIGMPKEVLVVALGRPISENTVSNGRKFLVFSQSWVERGGGYSVSEPRTETVQGINYNRRGKKDGTYTETRTVYVDRWVPPYSRNQVCVVGFEIDSRGRAALYQYLGDGCVGLEEKK